MTAGIATLASGAPMGLEGPSLYLGSSVGDMLQRRFPRLFSAQNRRLLLVAGAGAGVAAIFKAPATGAVFALEVPYHDDFARRMLAPTLVASATSYLAFVAIHGTAPLLAVTGSPPFSFKDIAAALALGAFAGIGARAFAWLLRTREARFDHDLRCGPRPDRGCRARGNLRTRTRRKWQEPHHRARLRHDPLGARPDTQPLDRRGHPRPALRRDVRDRRGWWRRWLVHSARRRRRTHRPTRRGSIHALDTSLFTVIGVAAFLGAGYRVPLAAITFVAEATGRPGFVVPGLLAAVVAELIMSRSSVTTYQQDEGADTETPPLRSDGDDAGAGLPSPQVAPLDHEP